MWREAGHTARACRCGLGYLDPPAAIGVTPDLHRDGYYAFPAVLRLAWVSQFCARGKLLEVGPGAGHLLAAARRRGYEVAGVDPNPASVRRIRDRLGIEIEHATIETSELPDASFDVVVHVDLLAHLVDPVAALRAMARRLRPGGHLCFEVGLTAEISPLWYRVLGRLDLPAHRWMFSRRSLERILARAGLAIVGTRRFGLVPSLGLVLAGRIASSLTGRPLDPDGLPPAQNAAHRLYDRLMCALRYRVGRITPDLGPQTLFVAARAA
ncbi:MAG: class I SAM-dependent methyltransferase [Kofleriaceae bacterium]